MSEASPERVEQRDQQDEIVAAYKREIDRSMLRESLKRSIDERLADLDDLQRFAEELQQAGRKARSRS